MSTEVLEPPAPIQPADSHDFSESAAAFDKEMGNEPKPAETKTGTPTPEKVEPVKAEATKIEPDFPEQLLTGEKPAPKTESAPEDDVLKAEPPSNLSKKGAADWVKLRDAAAKKATEIETLRKELELVKAQPVTKPDEATIAELTAAKERLSELEQNLERASFERSTKFQAFVTSEKANIDGAKSFLEGAKDADGVDIDASVIDRAAALTGVKRLEVLRKAGLDSETIAAVAPYLTAVDGINRQKAESLANHKQTAAQWEAQAQAQAEQVRAREKAEEDRVFKEVGLEVSSKFEPFQKVEGHEKWNAQVDSLNAEAEEFFNGNVPLKRLAEIARYGVGAKVIHSMFHSTRAELKSAREEIAKLKAAQPGGGEEAKKDPAAEAKMDPFERAAAEFERQMGR